MKKLSFVLLSMMLLAITSCDFTNKSKGETNQDEEQVDSLQRIISQKDG